MSLIFLIGTRAQLVKMAPVVREAQAAGVAHELLLTGQHLDSMADLAEDLGLGAAFPQCQLLTEQSSVGALIGWLPRAFTRCLGQLRAIRRRDPDAVVLVHGDTASTLVGAVAARFARLKLAHVESGLSSGAAFDPFPEEGIRRVVARLAHVAFCPDDESFGRLRGRRGLVVHHTHGNTIADALRLAVGAGGPATAGAHLLVSLHRFENIMPRARLQALVEGVVRLAQAFPVRFVLHPPTEKRLRESGLLPLLQQAGVELLPRMPYSRFMQQAGTARVVVTDGGSNQEELSLLGVPAVILRARTERRDGLGRSAVMEPEIEGGWVDYVLSGRADALRRPRPDWGDDSPARRIVESLSPSRAA